MKVRKRNGNIQIFSPNKIKLTLERVSDELGRPFTGSDLGMLIGAIERDINGRGMETIDSSEIQSIVVAKLKEFGFGKIANAYDEFRGSF